MNYNSFGLLKVIIFVLLLAGCDSSMNLYPNPDMQIDNQQGWQKKLYFERITEFKKLQLVKIKSFFLAIVLFRVVVIGMSGTNALISLIEEFQVTIQMVF